MDELQQTLDRLARSRPGPEQISRHDGITRFHSHSRRHGGWTYEVHDYAKGREVPVQSPSADERRFVTASKGYWRYRFAPTDAPIADPSALERQIAEATFVAQGHGLDPR